MRIIATVWFFLCVIIISSCSSAFIKKNEIKNIKNYENKEYILKEDAGEGKRLLKKGEKIKLYIITDDDYIKVYCYPSKTDFVKAERTLLLYLFKEDFEKERFSSDLFENKLFSKIELAKAAEVKKK